jgi:hypothetical protein
MVDVEDDAHWWWDGVNFPYWLPDGRLLKVTQSGAVLVGQAGAWQDLEAPTPISFFPLVADGIGFAGAQPDDNGVLYRGLWRVDLATKTWELAAPEMTISRLALAQDGSYVLALAFHEDRLWRVPVALDASLDSTTMQSIYDPLGSGGSPPPPTHLRNTTRWLLHRGAILNEREADQGLPLHFGLLYDGENGRLLRYHDLPVIAPEPYNFDRRYDAPPNGEWLAITLWALSDDPSPQITDRALYVAPGDDLAAGRLLPGLALVSWLKEPTAVIVRDVETGALSLYLLPITEKSSPIALHSAGSVIVSSPMTKEPVVLATDLDACWGRCPLAYGIPHTILLRNEETETLSIVRLMDAGEAKQTTLVGAGEMLATLGTSIFAADAENPAQILHFDAQGNLRESLELSGAYETIEYAFVAPARNSLYLSGAGRNDTYGLIEWQPPIE